jgi:hypothetical protein
MHLAESRRPTLKLVKFNEADAEPTLSPIPIHYINCQLSPHLPNQLPHQLPHQPDSPLPPNSLNPPPNPLHLQIQITILIDSLNQIGLVIFDCGGHRG